MAPELISDSADSARTVKSADRTLRILELLSRAPMSVTELHRESGYPRSSLHHLVHTLTSAGWVEVTPSGDIAIGSRALVVGTSYLDRDAALRLGAGVLEEVRDASGYTTHYARREGSHILYLATRETTNSHRAASRVGRRLPAHATSLGKALLAELSEQELERALGPEPLVAVTDATITDRARLSTELDAIRRAGFATERGEAAPGVSCVAAVVPYRIPATDAISCSIPDERATPDEIARVSEILLSTAADLAGRLRQAGVR